MQVFLSKESLGTLTKTGNTTVQYSPSVMTIGAKQYTSGNLVCDSGISGAGGLDVGAIAPNKTYYVYAVVQSGSVALIFSLANSPSGFSEYEQIGEMGTNSSSQIYEAINSGELFTPRFEKKKLSGNIQGPTVINELGINSLVIGESYELSYNFVFRVNYQNIYDGGFVGVTILDGAVLLAQPMLNVQAGNDPDTKVHSGSRLTFVATSTSVTFTSFGANARNHIQGTSNFSETWIQIKESNAVEVA